MSLQFAYWAPNVSGGLVISNLPQKRIGRLKRINAMHKLLSALVLIMFCYKRDFLPAMVQRNN